jgi:HD-GYP domain-containing protein (c-di-GMP phosphodiesterase class II)
LTRVSVIAPLSPAKSFFAPGSALWDRDPALLLQFRDIVSHAASVASGARLIMALPRGEPQVLASARCASQPWRPLGLAVLESGEPIAYPGVAAAPVHSVQGVRGALLLYCDSSRAFLRDECLAMARAHASHIESLLGAAAARLTAIQATTDALLAMLAAHDPTTARHARAVCLLARIMGEAIELPAHELLPLERAALLHDLGKVAVPCTVLEKTGPLSTSEWGLMRQHPATGERLVRAIPDLIPIAPAIRHHHEWWNGAGYPDRLSGEAIPIHARLIALVDAFETMRVGRPYRPALDAAETLRELRKQSGVQFDPALIAVLPRLNSLALAL